MWGGSCFAILNMIHRASGGTEKSTITRMRVILLCSICSDVQTAEGKRVLPRVAHTAAWSAPGLMAAGHKADFTVGRGRQWLWKSSNKTQRAHHCLQMKLPSTSAQTHLSGWLQCRRPDSPSLPGELAPVLIGSSCKSRAGRWWSAGLSRIASGQCGRSMRVTLSPLRWIRHRPVIAARIDIIQ